jgi:anti-sigma B factor antagonist
MTRENLLIMDCLVEGEAGRLDLNGELIVETRFEVERLLREWLESGIRRVIIRCRTLSAIDSAGFSTLLGALHRYRREGGDLILAELNPELHALFEITAMEKYFNIFETLEAAHAHFVQVAEERRRRGPAPAPPPKAKA